MKVIKPWRYIITGVTTAAVMSLANLALADTAVTEDDCPPPGIHGGPHPGGPGIGGRGGEGWGMRGPGMEHPLMHHLAEELALTDEQKAALKTHRKAERETMKAARKQMFEAQKALQDAVENGVADDQLAVLASKVGELTAQGAMHRAKSQQYFQSILTPEQKQTLADMKAERKARKQEARGNTKT